MAPKRKRTTGKPPEENRASKISEKVAEKQKDTRTVIEDEGREYINKLRKHTHIILNTFLDDVRIERNMFVTRRNKAKGRRSDRVEKL